MNMETASYVDSVPTIKWHLSYDKFFALHSFQTVTVAELIAMLQEYPADMVVCCHDDEYDSEMIVSATRLGILEHWQGHYAGEGNGRYLIGKELHTCDVVIIE